MKAVTFCSLALLAKEAVALPHINPDTPIPLNAFKFNKRDGLDPHLGIDPETIRKYASMAPPAPGLNKRVIDFNPAEQLVDGEWFPSAQFFDVGRRPANSSQCMAIMSSSRQTGRPVMSAVCARVLTPWPTTTTCLAMVLRP